MSGIYNPGSGSGGAPTTAQYVTLATDGTLSAERVLTAGTNGAGILLTDAGAGSTVTVDINNERWAVVANDVTHAQSNTSLSDVTGLLVAISSSATEIWQFEVQLATVAANATVDWKWGWSVPASCTMLWGPLSQAGAAYYYNPGGPATSNTDALLVQSDTFAHASGNITSGLRLYGWIYGGGTSGNVQLQFAQNTSNASNITVKKGSLLIARRVVA